MRRNALKLALLAPAGAAAALAIGAGTATAQGQYDSGCALGPQTAFTPAPRTGDAVRLSLAQLLINQRIDQAGINRANSIKAKLDGNVTTADIRDGSLCQGVYAGIILTGTATAPVPGPFSPLRRLTITSAPRAGGRLTLTANQLLINQRISQTVIVRANILRERLRQGLTGGDIQDGTLLAADNLTGLSFGTRTRVAPVAGTAGFTLQTPPRRGGTVRLTAQQLLINQRISQAAINRLNAIRLKVEGGFTGADFRAQSITVVDLDRSLQPPS